jgi:hypothetical protein
MRRLATTLAVAAIAAASLGVAGCGGAKKSGGRAAAHGTTASTGAASTGAATLRASLTGLLVDHVYLVDFAVARLVHDGAAADSYRAAAGALDKNSVALADAVGAIYGSPAGQRFLALWRHRVGLVVDYAKGRAAHDSAGTAKALAGLDTDNRSFAALVASLDAKLPAPRLAAELQADLASLTKALDAAATGSTSVFARLRVAADRVPATAAVLAAGIKQQFPARFPGSPDIAVAELRAGLTSLLEDQVYLAAIAVDTGVRDGFGSPSFARAKAAVDDATQALSDAISAVYGADAGNQLLTVWSKQIGYLAAYAKAKQTKSQTLAEAALANLDGHRLAVGALFADVGSTLDKQAIADELKPAIDTIAAAIRADVLHSAKTYDLIRAAANHMPHTAEVLANAISRQYPKRFPGAS